MKNLKISLFLLFFPPAGAALGCDLCNVYNAIEARGESGQGWHVSLAEQFTHFDTLQQDSVKVPNDVPQYWDSSISQLVLGYNFTDRVGVQFNLPLIHRSFQRPDGFDIDRGTETGVGDVSLLGHALLYRHETKKSTFTWHVLGGVKFPTGSTDRLHEEVDELTAPPPPPGAPDSGIHGHDLTLGSGSVDGLIGTGIFTRWQRVFLNANVQYSIRTTGDFDYRYANDLMWAGGPGVFLWLKQEFTVALQASVSGETKGRDTFMGVSADDTGITTVFLGPQLSATLKDKFSAELGVDLPVSIRNTALQSVPDWRVRAGLTWRF